MHIVFICDKIDVIGRGIVTLLSILYDRNIKSSENFVWIIFASLAHINSYRL